MNIFQMQPCLGIRIVNRSPGKELVDVLVSVPDRQVAQLDLREHSSLNQPTTVENNRFALVVVYIVQLHEQTRWIRSLKLFVVGLHAADVLVKDCCLEVSVVP